MLQPESATGPGPGSAVPPPMRGVMRGIMRGVMRGTLRRFAFIRLLTLIFVVASLVAVPFLAAAGAQDTNYVPRLREGGTVFLKNDMQASRESPTVFREFRRQMRKIEQFEAVDSEDEADLIVILSGDRDVLGRGAIKNQGLPYPDGYSSTKPMILLIYDAETELLLWFDAEPWQTVGNTGGRLSHELLVKRLAVAIENEGDGQ